MDFRATESRSIPFGAYGEEAASYDGGSRIDYNTIRTLIDRIVGRTKEERIGQSLDWAKKDDFLQSLIRIKTNFSVVGCTFTAKAEELSDLEDHLSVSSGKSFDPNTRDIILSDKQQESLKKMRKHQRFANKVGEKWNLVPVVRSLLKDWHECDSMILYWKVADPQATELSSFSSAKHQLLPGVLQITSLNPRHCRYDNSAGNDRMLYKLPQELYARIFTIYYHRDPAIRASGLRMLLEEGIPQDWIIAVSKGQTEVELSRETGDRWIVETKERAHEGLADPSMQCIFPFLEERTMLKHGEYSAAYMMKHFILHITMGESIDSGPLAGERLNWATPEETKKMHEVVTRTAKTMRLVTNHTVKFNFIFPPNEIWDGTKYKTPEEAIARWAGVVKVLYSGDGATGSSGHIGVKQMIADMLYARDRVRHIFSEFFDDPSVRSGIKDSEDVCFAPKFDENVLKDSGQLLKEIEALFRANAIDPESMLRELGRDPHLIRERKLAAAVDNQATGVWQPMYNNFAMPEGQQVSSGNKGGRPPNEGTITDADTLNQPPTLK